MHKIQTDEKSSVFSFYSLTNLKLLYIIIKILCPESGDHLKKIISFFCIAFLLLCAGCSKEPTEEEISNYIGEGMMTNFRLLFVENEHFVNEVFINSHLPVDSSQTVSKDGKTYAKVVSDRYASYSDLESSVRSVYCTSVAENLLKEKNFYIDINGALYFDMSADSEKVEGPVWNVEKAESVSVGKEEYIFSIPCIVNGKKSDSEFRIILDNNEWRLAEVYSD